MTNRITEHFDDMDELLEAGAPADFGNGVFLYLPPDLLIHHILRNLGLICKAIDAPDTSATCRANLERAREALLVFQLRLYAEGPEPLFLRLERATDE